MTINVSDNEFNAGRDISFSITNNEKSSLELKKEEVTQILENLLDLCEQNQNLPDNETKRRIEAIKASHPNVMQMNAEIVKRTIESNKSLKQRFKSAGTVAYLETIKMLFPPASIVIEAVKAWNKAGQS